MNKLIEIALSQYGVSEIAGVKDNPVILNYFKEIGETWVKTEDTAWCSAFINWVCLKAGVERSKKLNARSWLDVGEIILEPQLGDIVIFSRGDPKGWQGHVALFIRELDGFIWVLGGNQGNMVKISPYSKDRLLGYRRVK